MSKFHRILVKKAQTVPPGPGVAGVSPSNLKPQTPQPHVAPVQAPTPQMPQSVNYFAKAGIDPHKYVGSAEDNEKLRLAIDPRKHTFYDAYVEVFKGWNQHPHDRINNLLGGQKQAPQPLPNNGAANANHAQTPGAQNAAQAPQVNHSTIPQAPIPSGAQRSTSGILIPPPPGK